MMMMMGRASNGIPLLSRMQRDLEQRRSIEPQTAALMWAAYAAHAGATAVAIKRRLLPVELPGAAAATVGRTAAIVGVGLCVLGMRRFAGLGELSGRQTQPLITDGIYRYSRNPQYLGYVVTLAGLSVARRSAASLALTGLLAVVYARWVPVEEEHLARTLSEPYLSYRASTNRWLGRRRKQVPTDTSSRAPSPGFVAGR